MTTAGAADPLFTVLLPVTRPPAMLPYAISSVLAQSESRFELVVIGDGAPSETIACAESFARRDSRVSVRAFRKGERHGEAHRHEVLADARGSLVAHIADDDLWFPDYLRELAVLLADVDFGNLLTALLQPDGEVVTLPGDLGDPRWREAVVTRWWTAFGISTGGYRLAAYRALPVGWSPAPAGRPTDVHMWRKFLAAPGLTFGTRFAVEEIGLQTPLRTGQSLEERAAETAAVAARVASEEGRRDLRERAVRGLQREFAKGFWAREDLAAGYAQVHGAYERTHEAYEQTRDAYARTRMAYERAAKLAVRRERELARVRASRSWRLTAPLRRGADVVRRRLARDDVP